MEQNCQKRLLRPTVVAPSKTQCGPIVVPALIADAGALPDLERFVFGSNEYPDRSTTLILQVASLIHGPAWELRGPGIDGVAVLNATFEPKDLFDRLSINATLFPRGIDVVLVADDAIAAIPRTTRATAHGG